MTPLSRSASVLIALVAAIAPAGAPVTIRAQAPAAAAPTLDLQMFDQGLALFNQGKYPEAIKHFEDLIKRYPTSPAVPQAHFRIGYTYYVAGEYDKSVEKLNALPNIKGVEPATLEIAASMIPQILIAKASKLPPGDKARDSAFADAVRQFDAYIKKYPNSREVEAATYSKSLALYQIGKYDEAAAALRENLQKFQQSPTILDSQYLLGLTIGTIANVAAEKATAPDPTIDKNYDEAERLLREIINKRPNPNLALLNDSQFQVGELLYMRGSHAPEKAKAPILQRALEAFRGVYPKEVVVAAQKQRVESFRAAAQNALVKNRDLAGRDYWLRVADREAEKIPALEERPDQTLTAKLRAGVIFFELGKMDESRVVLNFVEPYTEEADAKKQILYFTTLTYAIQNKLEKAVEKYEAFQAAHKGDKIAENLDLVIGSMFLNSDPKINNPAKAIEYFKRGVATYPKGRFTSELVMQQAMAEIQLNKFDDALKVLTAFLNSKPAKELALAAEYGIGIVYMKTNKMAEAIKTFETVRDKYAGTPQAEDSAFYAAQLKLSTSPKDAVAELSKFITSFASSERLPEALYSLGQGQGMLNQKEAAAKTFKELADKYPQSTPAPFSYFERARILAGDQKFDEVMTLLKDFMHKYDDNEALYQAYDFVAQIQTSQGKGMEAIATFEEFVKKKPQSPSAADALIKLSSLWKGYGESQGPYLALNEQKRAEWKKGVDNSLDAAQRVVMNYPDSPAVSFALSNLLENLRLQQRVKLKTDADIESYFKNLAEKAGSKPELRSKIVFTLASYTFDKDKAKALAEMQQVYKPDLRIAPEELDLYGLSLIENKKYDEALAIYKKIAADFPTPPNTEPTKAARDIQDAQAIALFGISKALQAQAAQLRADKKPDEAAAKSAEAGAKSEELKRLYGWSKKALEANYPLAQSLHDSKKDDDAMKLLIEVVKAKEATPELRARSMLLLGKIHEANGRYDAAIDNYIKIAAYYSAIADAAAEGLWLGGQLLEKQANGQIPMPTPTPKPEPGAKPAAAAKPAAKENATEAKPATAPAKK